MSPRLLVVGHPNVVPHNQLTYLRLAERGWELDVIVPNRWVDAYTPGGFAPVAAPGFCGNFFRVRCVLPGREQRLLYVTRPTRWLRRLRPDVVFVEQEPYAIPMVEWGQACERLGIPWGVQGDDNLPRALPWPARLIRRWAMPRIDFFAARSPGAVDVLEQWGAHAPTAIVPHTLPEWAAPPRPARECFTVGYAGRLVEAKGIDELLGAVRRLPFASRLLMVGDGPLRERIEQAELGHCRAEVRTGLRSDEMPGAYAEMDVLVLPSRTTPTWAEQFGKVLGEALLCGTPVVGSSSGEIPWVIETTGGGVTFPEGDAAALAAALVRLEADPVLREELAARGAAGTRKHFSPTQASHALERLLEQALR